MVFRLELDSLTEFITAKQSEIRFGRLCLGSETKILT